MIPKSGGIARLVAAVLGMLACGVALDLAQAEDPHIAKLRATEQKTFTDAQIIDGFFKTAFGAEFAVAGRTDRIRKYDAPVRVFVENRGKPDRRRQVADAVADIK